MADAATGPAVETPKRRNRWRYALITVACVGAVAWMLVLMQRNVVFFKPVSEAVHDEVHDGTRTLRIGGGVVPQSIHQRDGGADFDLYQGGVTVTVHHEGDEPQLFKDCAPVVAEGHWDPSRPRVFDSTRLLIKHGNDYEPPAHGGTQCPKDPFK